MATGLSTILCIPNMADCGGFMIGVLNIDPKTPPFVIVNVPPVISSMEKEGILIDKLVLNSLSIEFQEKLNKLQKSIFDYCDEEFNIASPKQLGEILFDKLNLPEDKKSKTGKHSTSISVLEDLSIKGFKIADLIIEWRGLAKLKSTYTDALQKNINIETIETASS